MAEPTGTARQEAERLVATVLAMASQAGLGGPAKDRDPEPAASPGVGEMLTGLVDQFLGGLTADSSSTARRRPTDADRRTAGDEPRQTADRRPDDRQADDRQADDRQADDRQADDRPAGDQHAADQRATGQHTADPRATGQHAADRQASARSATDPKGSGGAQGSSGQSGADHHQRDPWAGLGGVWQAAGHRLWEDVGRRNGWSTGTAECCICPICRTIAGMRDPSPERAERLATGAGDFASGVASMLRAFSVVTGTSGTSSRRKPPARPTTTPDQAWSAATRTTEPTDDTPPAREGDNPWTAATRAPRPQPATTPKAATETGTGDTPPAREAREGDDPWTAATRTPRPATTPTTATEPADAEPATPEPNAWIVTPEGAVSDPTEATPPPDRPTPAGQQRDPWAAATHAPEQPRPAALRGRATRAGSAHQEPLRNPAAAADEAATRTGKATHRPESAGRVTGATDVWAAATAANSDTAGDSGVADTPSVDHDVPGTAPAASAAEGRGAGSGDDARAGDAV